MTVNILGTVHTIHLRKGSEDSKLKECDGYHEPYSKEIVIETDFEIDSRSCKNLDLFQNKVMRHEIIHAFLQESGLAENSTFGRNEEMIDWIALQMPKMVEVMKKAGCL